MYAYMPPHVFVAAIAGLGRVARLAVLGEEAEGGVAGKGCCVKLVKVDHSVLHEGLRRERLGGGRDERRPPGVGHAAVGHAGVGGTTPHPLVLPSPLLSSPISPFCMCIC